MWLLVMLGVQARATDGVSDGSSSSDDDSSSIITLFDDILMHFEYI